MKRHSAKLVEAAFDGEVDEVTSWLEKGYYVDSCDGRKNTALSEAACQGHDEVVRLLLQQVSLFFTTKYTCRPEFVCFEEPSR